MSLIETNIDRELLTFIPYILWDNRDARTMKVWINFNNETTLY
ncbi:hypothetical protein ACUNWD_19510 [Sunxiuqinia sp. A32]